MKEEFGYFEPEAGGRLRFARFEPEEGTPRGSVVLIQGRTEFVEKYSAEVIPELVESGFQVWTFDLRGQGLSDRLLKERLKGHIDSFYTYVRDLRSFLQDVVEPKLAPGPCYLLSHSLGSLLALLYLREDPSFFDRAVLISPLLGMPSPLPDWALSFLAKAAIWLGLEKEFMSIGKYVKKPRIFEGNPWTSDRGRLHRTTAMMEKNPDLEIGGVTFRWFYEALRAIDACFRPGFAAQITTPILIVASGDDRCVRLEATQRFAPGLLRGKMIVLEGAAHEILFERDVFREKFWNLFFDFVEAPAPVKKTAKARPERMPSEAQCVQPAL